MNAEDIVVNDVNARRCGKVKVIPERSENDSREKWELARGDKR